MTTASEQAAIEWLAEFLAAHALLLLVIGLVLSTLAIPHIPARETGCHRRHDRCRAVVLMVRGQRALAAARLGAQAGTAVLVVVLKALSARTRPAFMDSAVETSWSFPSGNAMATLVPAAVAGSVFLRS